MASAPLHDAKWTFQSVTGASTGADGDATTNAPVSGRRNRWRAGLCECCSYPLSCLSTIFCEACVIGQTSSIAMGGSRNACLLVGAILLVFGALGLALQLVSEDAVTMAGSVFLYVGGVIGLFLICYARITIRERKSIEGSGFGDCCISFWCSPCSICQARQPLRICTFAGLSGRHANLSPHPHLPSSQMLNEYGRYRGFWDGYQVLDEEQAGGGGGGGASATAAAVATPMGVALVSAPVRR